MRFALAGSRSWRRSLSYWDAQPRTDDRPGRRLNDHHEVAVRAPAGRSPDEVFLAVRERLFTYRMFPPSVLRAMVGTANGRVSEGCVVVARAFFPLSPVALEFGVRVIDVWEHSDAERHVAGLAIATVEGHPETGRERFEAHLHRASGEVELTIIVEARPGPLLVRLLSPVSRWFQLRATRAALRSFGSNPVSLLGTEFEHW